MGIYPVTADTPLPGGGFKRVYDDFSGLITTTYFMPVLEITCRENCFCCSCPDIGGSDPACRNHGFAGLRPCEEHGTPGSTWDEEMVPEWEGIMPESVQEVRARDRAGEI